MVFKDHFSAHAGDYSLFRPDYPDALYQWLSARCQMHDRAWDCATGNGQAAVGLADHFLHIDATDASAQQISNAAANDRISYRVASAESSELAPQSVDLVTVAQALHWFNLEPFYAEVKRVLKPGGLLAAWSYELTTVNPAVDAVVNHLYADILGRYWPAERLLVERGYRDLPFPFAEIEVPQLSMQASWSLEHFAGYLDTWSAVRRFRDDRGHDPLDSVRLELFSAWGDPDRLAEVRWPLSMRAGYSG